MALWGGSMTCRTMVAGEDLTDKQFRLLAPTGAQIGTNLEVAVADSAGMECVGTCWSKAPMGRGVSVAQEGETIGVVGAAVNAGDALATDNQGRVVPAIAGDFIVAQSQEDAANVGEMIRVLLQVPNVKKVA